MVVVHVGVCCRAVVGRSIYLHLHGLHFAVVNHLHLSCTRGYIEFFVIDHLILYVVFGFVSQPAKPVVAVLRLVVMLADGNKSSRFSLVAVIPV